MKTATTWIRKIESMGFVEYQILTRKSNRSTWVFWASTDNYKFAQKILKLAKEQGYSK